MKTTWTRTIPSQEGWCWIKYKGKRGTVKVPAQVVIFRDKEIPVMVTSARNDTFHCNPATGAITYDGQPDETVMFGPPIPKPED